MNQFGRSSSPSTDLLSSDAPAGEKIFLFAVAATGFASSGISTPPYAGVCATFAITFDRTTDQLADKPVDGFSVMPASLAASGVSYTYRANDNGGELTIGGPLNGVGSASGLTDDFYFIINDVRTIPYFRNSAFTTSGSSNTFQSENGVVTMT